MSYLGRKGASAALTSADIPDNSITGAKIVAGTIEASDVAADMATQAEIDLKANIASPTFTGVATAPSLVLTPGSAPGDPAEGEIYYNSTTNMVTLYNGDRWVQLHGSLGGVITTYTVGGTDYIVHTFTSSGTFVVSGGSLTCDILVVAGGGSGGHIYCSGGGGGGGMCVTGSSYPVLDVGTYTITVGAGGARPTTAPTTARGNNGADSYFANGSGTYEIRSKGGGGGGRYRYDTEGAGRDGGSGGGAHVSAANMLTSFAGGISNQTLYADSYALEYGNSGGAGGINSPDGYHAAGAGGGAGGVGETGHNDGHGTIGGIGFQNLFQTGSNIYYGAGGGGGGGISGNIGVGGNTGTASAGGSSGDADGTNGGDGAINYGAGGGGSGQSATSYAGLGGSGIVIIRYAI